MPNFEVIMKTFKVKITIIALLVLALCVSTFILVACQETDPAPSPDPSDGHIHSYVIVDHISPTCTESGCDVYSCTCGDAKTENIDPLGHDLEWRSDESGEKHFQACKRSGCEYKTEAVAHSYDVTVKTDKLPTCTEEGMETVACECGATKTQSIDKIAHKFTVVNKDGNYHWNECEVCHAPDETSRAAHSYTVRESITQSTCETQGEEVTRCVCGATHTETLPLAQHKYIYVYNGQQHWEQCSVCSAEKENSRADHTMVVTSQTEATCTEQGVTEKACVCGKTEQISTPELGHDLDKTAFSKKTNAGHFYKCKRCEEEQIETHTLVDVDCPDGHNKEATCGAAGHQDKRCTVCDFSFHTSVPATGAHVWSQDDDLQHNGTEHWHYCTVCGAEGEKTAHTWQWKTVQEVTCTQNGLEQEICECGQVRASRTVQSSGHNYLPKEETRKQPTCTEEGSVEIECSVCGDVKTEKTDKLDHSFGEYQADDGKHWKECEVCHYKNEGNHNYVELTAERKTATCQEEGYRKEKCTACQHVKTTVLPKTQHQYSLDPDDFRDSTCTVHGYHVNVCSVCNDRQVVEEELAPHTLDYYGEQPATDEADGWIKHWRCSVCLGYFADKQGTEPLTEEDVIVSKVNATVLSSISQLNELAEQFIQSESSKFYVITLNVYACDGEEAFLEDNAGDLVDLYFSDLDSKYDVYSIKESNKITLRGNLLFQNDKLPMVNIEIIDVDDNDPDLLSLYVEVELNATGSIILEAQSEMEEYPFTFISYGYTSCLVYFNCLLKGESLTFSFTSYSNNPNRDQNAIVSYLVINGKSYTMTDGQLQIEVTEDIHAKFEISYYDLQNVTLTSVDTSENNAEKKVDPYVSYVYTGTANEYGRLYANSYLRFTVANAYITSIKIEFEDYEIDKMKNNPVNVGKDNLHKEKQTYVLNGTTLSLSFDKSSGYSYFEYNAQAQARIKSIRIEYRTYNS